MSSVKKILVLLAICAMGNPALAQVSKTDQRRIEKVRTKVEKAFENGHATIVELMDGSKLRGVIVKTQPETFTLGATDGLREVRYHDVRKVKEIKLRGSNRALVALAVGGAIIGLAILFTPR